MENPKNSKKLAILHDDAHRYLAAIVESSDDAIVSKDLNGVITSWNKGAEEIFGYTSEEIVGRSVMVLLPSDHKEEEQSILNKIRRGERIKHYETIRVRKDGSLLNVSLTISPIKNESGDIIGASKIARDITEQLLLQEKFKMAKEEAERANQSKSIFLANMSHEIRTPITAILGFTELLTDRTISASEQEEAITVIRRNGHMLLKLVNDLLDISKIEAERIELEKTPFSLRELLEELASTVALKAKEKGLKFTTSLQVEEGVSKEVIGDSLKIRQVLLNLINNAIKFTETGQISLALCASRNQKSPENLNLVFEVQDSGLGIPPEQRETIFQAFSQGDPALHRKQGGVGLGLFISKRLARVMGGDLALVSTHPGKGSLFAFSLKLPLKDQAAHPSRLNPFRVETKPLQGLRILLAEDAYDNALLLSRNLKHMGAYVDVASDGEEAVEKARHEYDVILMDLQMPVVDGYEATRRLRTSGYSKPIVALTAHAMSEEKGRALTSGFNAYLTKPLDHAVLIKTLRDLKKNQN